MIRNIITLFCLLFSLSLQSQVAAEYNNILSTTPTTGTYAIRGRFFNDEPVIALIDEQEVVVNVNNITTDSTTYYIDTKGDVYYVVGKSGTASNLLLELDPEDLNNLIAPATGRGQITGINPLTNEFYISGPSSSAVKAKIQRINNLRRLQTGGTINVDTLVSRQELIDSLASIQAPDGGVTTSYVNMAINDSLTVVRDLIKQETLIAKFLGNSFQNFYQLVDDLDETQEIKVFINGVKEPFDSTNDGTGLGNVYYNPVLNRIIWKFSGYYSGDLVEIRAVKL